VDGLQDHDYPVVLAKPFRREGGPLLSKGSKSLDFPCSPEDVSPEDNGDDRVMPHRQHWSNPVIVVANPNGIGGKAALARNHVSFALAFPFVDGIVPLCGAHAPCSLK
jgi:hypothetical protein